MKTRGLYQKSILCGIILFLFFGSIFANSDVTDGEQYWGPLRESYTYIWDDDHYNYKLAEPRIVNYEEITIWDVESEGNEISFRSDKWEVFLGMVHCENQSHYDLYRAAWLYENETESFEVTYRYDNATQELGFVDPLTLDFMGQTADVPVNPMELPANLFMFYKGLGFNFLPVLHNKFSFETDFQIYELVYPDFEIEFKDNFKFQRKRFEGYCYTYSYTFEEQLYPGVLYKEEIYRCFSYNTQGVLYDFYNDYTFSTNISGQYEIETEGVFKYYLESYDETLVVAHAWMFGVSAIFITSTIVVYKRRKR